ncbi:MAG: hypothetical protein J3R72DRAFT_194321 [Linnemannia gamsii]|nr:MAG: hypothetical protein J3R72DRAFT_194321 [Linnemannia gamsii]
MAKIFSVTPAELDTRLKDRNNSLSLYNIDSPSSPTFSDASSSYPTTPTTDAHSSDLFSSSSPFRPSTKSTSSLTTAPPKNDLSKIVLSFFLSPTGYRLLRFDTKQKASKKDKYALSSSSSTNNKTKNKASVTLSNKSLQKLGSSLVDPEEYEQWFKSRTSTSSADNSVNYNNKRSTTTVQKRITELSSATRTGIRGFTLAFLAGSAMDVLLPALLKRKFRGLARRILTNPSSLELGASCGLFAFVYKLSFHLIALALEHISGNQEEGQEVLWGGASRRSDSGIELGGRQQGRGIVFGGLTQLDSNNGQNENHDHHHQDIDSDNDNDTLRLSPKELAARNRKKWIPALLASLIAAPAYSLISDQARQLTMALYFLTYAGESAYAALEHEGLLKWLPSWFGVWILAPISVSQIVHTFIHHNDCNPVGWTKLIMSQCDPYLHKPKGFDTKTLGPFPSSGPLFVGMKEYINAGYNSQPILASATTAASAALAGDGSVKRFLLPEACEGLHKFVEGMGHNSAGCAIYHPGEASCSSALKQLLGRNAVFSFKMYAVLAALTFIARGGNVFQKGVMNYISKTTIATLRSTIATWGLVITAFPLYCAMDRTLPDWFLPTKRHYLNGLMGGFWVLLETPARQSALTLYFTRFMMEALWRRGVKAGVVRQWKKGRGEMALFGCAMAVIMGVFETTRTSEKKLERKTIIQTMLNKIFVD